MLTEQELEAITEDAAPACFVLNRASCVELAQRVLVAERQVADLNGRRCRTCRFFDGVGNGRGLCVHLVTVRSGDWSCADWREVPK